MSLVCASFSRSQRSRCGNFISFNLEVSEGSARGSQAGLNKGFKTFTIQLKAPPSWALKGICDFMSLTLDYSEALFCSSSGCSLTEVQAQIEHCSISGLPALASLPWPPIKFRICFKIVLITYKALPGPAQGNLFELLIPLNYEIPQVLILTTAGDPRLNQAVRPTLFAAF